MSTEREKTLLVVLGDLIGEHQTMLEDLYHKVAGADLDKDVAKLIEHIEKVSKVWGDRYLQEDFRLADIDENITKITEELNNSLKLLKTTKDIVVEL